MASRAREYLLWNIWRSVYPLRYLVLQTRSYAMSLVIDARNYAVSEILRDGTPVTIRAIRREDSNRILTAFNHLDRESVYTRFFTYKKGLTDSELNNLADVNFDHVVALVVTTGTEG